MKEINYKPDILSCLSSLSTDEVFTPPKLVGEMLDSLPNYIWQSSKTKILDPFCKSGVFLREAAKRLISGLENEIPDIQERIDHILINQLFGISITEITSLISRRTLYCSKMANGDHSICSSFSNSNGNIYYSRTEHEWKKGKCVHCGVKEGVYDRGEDLESHAYQFIHEKNPAGICNMEFDVIIGNPPYHLSDSGKSTGSSPIYQLFVEKAKDLNPKYISMIIPSRWFAGGKGLDNFRNEMLGDRRISKLIDFPITKDVFPSTIKIIGGVCYFLWDKNYEGDCEVTTVMKGERHTSKRPLNKYDTFVRFNKATTLLEKVIERKYKPLRNKVSTQKPFGLRTYEKPSGSGNVMLFAKGTKGLIEQEKITRGTEMLESWKVFLSMGYGEGGETREYPRMILGKPIVAPPSSACTETYIVISTFDDQESAENLSAYLQTKFVRFLVGLRKNTQHITKDRFEFVPDLPMNRSWNDNDLYEHFNLSKEEILFVEEMIRPRE